MDLARKNELLELDALRSQRLRQPHRLAEGDSAIVIAVDEQHRRPLILYVRQW